MDLIEQIEKIITSTGISKNKMNLEDVKRHHTMGHFKKGYELKIKYTSPNEIKEIVLKEPSFEYIIYRHNT
ncbi:MAG: hypothetical protein ABH804_01020 [archaeon]